MAAHAVHAAHMGMTVRTIRLKGAPSVASGVMLGAKIHSTLVSLVPTVARNSVICRNGPAHGTVAARHPAFATGPSHYSPCGVSWALILSSEQWVHPTGAAIYVHDAFPTALRAISVATHRQSPTSEHWTCAL